MPDTASVVLAVIGGVCSAICTGGPLTAIFLYWRNRLDANMARLEDDLKSLREEKVERIERRMEGNKEQLDTHVRGDQTRQILSQLQSLSGMLERMSAKLDAVREETAEQRADIKNAYSYVKDVDASLKQHLREIH